MGTFKTLEQAVLVNTTARSILNLEKRSALSERDIEFNVKLAEKAALEALSSLNKETEAKEEEHSSNPSQSDKRAEENELCSTPCQSNHTPKRKDETSMVLSNEARQTYAPNPNSSVNDFDVAGVYRYGSSVKWVSWISPVKLYLIQ